MRIISTTQGNRTVSAIDVEKVSLVCIEGNRVTAIVDGQSFTFNHPTVVSAEKFFDCIYKALCDIQSKEAK